MIDRGFASGVQQKRSEQAGDSRSHVGTSASYGRTEVFSENPQIGLRGGTNKMEWSNSGINEKAGFYVSSSASQDAALNRTMGILCADYNLCIDYNPPAPLFGNWQGNIVPLEGGYFSPTQVAGTYRNTASANTSSAAASAYTPNSATGDVMPVALSDANASADQGSGLATSGTVTQSALTNGNSRVLSASATGSVTDSYQGATSRAFSSSISSDDSSDQSDPLHLQGGSPAPRVTPAGIQHASQPGSDSTPAVDSELRVVGDQIINQSAGSVNWWPIGTFGTSSDVPGSGTWPLEFHDPGPMFQFPSSLTDPPNPGVSPTDVINPASPVPEPSELLLMFTVVALIALAAKRSGSKYRVAGRTGIPTS